MKLIAKHRYLQETEPVFEAEESDSSLDQDQPCQPQAVTITCSLGSLTAKFSKGIRREDGRAISVSESGRRTSSEASLGNLFLPHETRAWAPTLPSSPGLKLTPTYSEGLRSVPGQQHGSPTSSFWLAQGTHGYPRMTVLWVTNTAFCLSLDSALCQGLERKTPDKRPSSSSPAPPMPRHTRGSGSHATPSLDLLDHLAWS